ncbi:MAG: glycosyltransferase family A protein [Candidatus Bathyarchaeia archaeon]
MKKRNSMPLVSVIIPTRNSQRTISQCLKSIENQTYKKTETIVIDRYSTDETVQTALQFKAKVFTLNCERSAAKNLGVKKANGEFVFFLDSDMELNPKTVEECVSLCQDGRFDAIAIPEVTVADGFLGKCRRLERDLYNYDPNSSLMPRFFRKETFLSISGFDEKLVCGEDFDLARRYENQGYQVGVAKVQIKHLEGRVSLRKVVLKAYYYGRNLVPFFSRKPALALREYCPTRFVFNIKRLLQKPKFMVGLATLKLFEYIAYSIGILSDMLIKALPIRE